MNSTRPPTSAEIRAKAEALRDAWGHREGLQLIPLRELVTDQQDIWLRAAESAILAERAAVLAERKACAEALHRAARTTENAGDFVLGIIHDPAYLITHYREEG